MATEITPKTMVQMLTQMVSATNAYRNYIGAEHYYFVLQGPKRWMDVFVHLNNGRPSVMIQYGLDPRKTIKVLLSNTGDNETFVLNFHRFGAPALIGLPLRPGPRLFRAGFNMGDGRKIAPRSDKKCYFEAADPSVNHDLLRSKKRDNVLS